MALCKYCGKDLDFSLEKRGFCDDCYIILTKNPLEFKKQILDFIDKPFFVVKVDTTLLYTANEKFLELTGKPFEEIVDSLGGDVVNCIHAEKDVCGQGPFCSDCPLRSLVIKTIKEDESHTGKALIQTRIEGQVKKIEFNIKTRRRLDFVYIQIEDYTIID